MTKGTEAGKIQVYVRVRPFTEREREKREVNAIEIHHEHSLIRVSDQRSRTNYFFDGVFGPDASNREVYQKVGRPLVYAAMKGYHGTLLTYGQTGTGKTYTLLSEDGVTSRIVDQCFERIEDDEIHNYKVSCSFLQVYQEKVYDLLNTRFIVDLSVREHPKKGVYVANLSQHEVKNAADVFNLIEIGKKHLVIAETKMVRYSSRSHSIIQLIIERRLKDHIVSEKVSTKNAGDASQEAVQESIMAVDETINCLLKELKQERKTHHRGERECLKDLMEKELHDGDNFEGDLIIKGKLNLCDLAGSERLTKTKAEGVRLTEAKYLNTSLLELGNVIHALARGQKGHVPYRNSTLTRLLQDCLGDNGKTNFIVCVAPTLGEVNETKCSLNFGLRAMRITNVARLNVEVDYRVLAERLAKKIEDQDLKHKFEKLEYLREIQRLKSAVTSYEENEHYDGNDHEKLVTVIANLSKSVKKEKEEKTNLRSELVCLKKQVTHSPCSSKPETEVQLLAELMSMELLCNLHQSDAMRKYVLKTNLPTRVKDFLKSVQTQEALILNAGYILQLLDLHLESSKDNEQRKELSDHLQFNVSHAGSVELVSKDCSIKISPLGTPREPVLSLPVYRKSPTSEGLGPAGGIRKMFGRLLGREPKEMTSPQKTSPKSPHAHVQHAYTNGHEFDGSGRARNEEDSSPDKAKTLMRKLAKSKEKVEEHVVNLLAEAFGEQMIPKEGKSPPWGEMSRRLSEFMMLKRNNMHGPVDGDFAIHSEEVAGILESCLRYVVIDKALLACLLVVELMHLQETAGSITGNTPRACRSTGQFERTSMLDQVIPNGVHDNASFQDAICAENVKNTNTLNDEKSGRKSLPRRSKSVDEAHNRSPSAQKEELRGLKEKKLSLEHEIRDVHEDTGRLETELFSTMEDRARIEDDLLGIRDHVNKLKTELFHLKIEKANLEADLRKTRSTDGARESHVSPDQLELELARGHLRDTELSDVMEASHESMDSENSSQMSDGHETREAFFKTCFANMSQVYSLMPSPENAVISEEDMSDGKEEPTLSDTNIDSDSEEDIVITKLARSMQGSRSPGNSPTKEKTKFGQGSPTRGGKKDIASNKSPSKTAKSKDAFSGPPATKDKMGSPTEVKTQEDLIRDLKKRLHKAEQDVRQLREANEDLDEDLTHKKGQLAKAQKTIIDLEGQVVEERDACEQVRQLYIDIKERCEVLESKAKTLRTELERALREKTVLAEMSHQGQPNEKNPQKSPKKLPSKGSPKSSNATKGIDLRYPPENTNTLSEIQMINLLEENAELKTKLDRISQDNVRLEHQKTQENGKVEKMESVLRFTEDQCRKMKEDILVLKKGKLQLGNDLSDLQSKNSDELEKYREKAAQLAKDLQVKNEMNEHLEGNNALLQNAVAKMESELLQWRKDFEVVYYECERLEGELLLSKEQSSAQQSVKDEKNQVEERISNDHERQERKEHQGEADEVQTMESKLAELRRLNSNLQSEIKGMSEYQQALEDQYAKVTSDSEKWKTELSQATSRLEELENQLHKEGREIQSPGDNKNVSGQKSVDRHRESNKTQHHMFYTLTGEISESSESLEPETAKGEEEMQLLKLENTYLLQQISEHEQTLRLHKETLEKANGTTLRLEKELEVAREQLSMTTKNQGCLEENNISNINTIKGRCELLQRKHSELLAENSKFQTKFQEACEQKDKLFAENEFMKAESASLREKVLHMQKEKREERKALTTTTSVELPENPGVMQRLAGPEQKKSEATLTTYPTKSSKDTNETTQLEEDLLRVTSEKLNLEFQLLNATAEIERLKADLEQTQSEKALISSQLNDNIQKVANLEIRLLEMRCSNESMKGEFVHLREEKRQESYYRQEASIHKEVMEKRLEETLMSKQKLRHELDNSIEKTQNALERIERLQKQKQDEETEVEQLRQQSQELQEELQNTMTKLKEFEDQAKQLEKEKHEIEEKIKTLRRQNFELKKVLQSRESQNQKAKEKVNNLEKRVKNMKLELERLQQRNTTLRKDFEAKETHKKDKATQCTVQDVNSENSRLKVELCRLQEEREQLKMCVAARRSNEEVIDALTTVKDKTNSDSGMDTELAEDTEKENSEESEEEDKAETLNDETTLPNIENTVSVMAMMCKEKLLLESTASRFSRVQMRLEQSLCKALAQNDTLKSKISENDAAMQVLRARVHELETQHEHAVRWKELKRQITISSDSDSDSDTSNPTSSDHAEVTASASEDKVEETIPTSEKGLEVILEADESVFLQQQLDTQQLSQEEAEAAENCENHDKEPALQEKRKIDIKVDEALDLVVEVTETSTDMKISEHENEQNNVEVEIVDDEATCSSLLTGESADLSQSDISFLKQEKETILAELQEVKHQYNLNENEVEKKTKACKCMEEELKVLTSAYEQEKDSLLAALENIRKENEDFKEKLQELQEFETTFDEVRKSKADVEKLVEELEKDLLRQTDIRKELERQLLSCQGQLEEMEDVRGQLLTISRENEDMVVVNTQLSAEINEAKIVNENLLRELDSQKRQVKSLEKRLHAQRPDTEQAPGGKVIQTHNEQNEEPKRTCTKLTSNNHDNQTDVKVESAQYDKENSAGEDLLAQPPVSTKIIQDEPVHCQENIPANGNIGKTIPWGKQKQNKGEATERDGDFITEESEADINGLREKLQRRNVDTKLAHACNGDREIKDVKITETALGENESDGEDEEQEEKNDKDTQQQDDAEENKENEGVQKYVEHKSHDEGVDESQKQERVSENELVESGEQPHWQESGATASNESAPIKVEKRQDEGAKMESEQKVEEPTEEQQRMLYEKEDKLREERLILEERIAVLIKENESLTSKIDTLQTQSEAASTEVLPNYDNNKELNVQLEECLEAKRRMEEENKILDTENARLEVELSDAIECREAIERELIRVTETGGQMRYELEDQLQELRESYSNIETALSRVLEENSRVETNLSLLQQENQMLKNYKILEITDNCTQFSPRTTEDESEMDGRRRKSSIRSLQSQTVEPKGVKSFYGFTSLNGSNLAELESAIPDSRSWSSMEFRVDKAPMENSGSTNAKSSQESSASVITPQSQDFQLSDEESNKHSPDSAAGRRELAYGYCNESSDDETNSEKLDREGGGTPTMSEPGSNHADDNQRFQRHLTSYQGRPNSVQYRQIHEGRESDEYESSAEVGTNSSLVSVTDLDISNSSDFISSEDGMSTGAHKQGYKRLQLDLAETKCSNTLLTNELSILKRHNCEIQNQLQKYVNRNNQLKQKVCDRTMSLRRTEKDVAATKEDNEGLLAKATAAKEELLKVEKEKAKLERNLASTKGENKRLKADLSSLRAEMYRTMKEVVNLQTENRKLHLDLSKQDSKKPINLLKNDPTLAHQVSASYNDLSAGPQGPVQEMSTSLMEQRANRDPACPQGYSCRASTPELTPVLLSNELKEATSEDFEKHWSQAIYRVSSLGGQTDSDISCYIEHERSFSTEPPANLGPAAQLYSSTTGGNEHVARRDTSENHALNRGKVQLSYDSIASSTAGGSEHVARRDTLENHALNRGAVQLSYDSIASSTAGGNEHVARRDTLENHALNRGAVQLSYDSIASSTAGGSEHMASEDHALNREERMEQESKSGNKKGIKTIFKKFHKSKKGKSAHKEQ